MQLTLRVEGTDGQTKVSVPAKTAERSDELLGSMTNGEVVLNRAAWDDVDTELDRRNDRLVVDDPRTGNNEFFAGRFDADSRGNGTVTVGIEGYELDARDAEPTGSNLVYQNVDDSQIVADLLALVPTLEAGTIETLATNLSMSFSHAEPSKALRDICDATGGELRYNDDRTVDYVDRLGTDKSEIVLSPDDQTVIGGPEITEDERENVTHIRGFGAQSGPDQVSAEAVADSYGGGKQVWREYENKDVKEESRLQRIIDQMVDEYDGEPRHLELEVDTVDLDINLGDRVHVRLPEENIDRMLRAIQRREILGTAGATLSLGLSNRLFTGQDNGQKSRKDLQRFNRGYQGFVDRSQITSGWNPAGDGTPQELVVVNWPDDIVEEHLAELHVQGRAWRSPVDPQPHSHDVTVEATTASGAGDSDYANPLDYAVLLSDGSSFTETFDLPNVNGDGAYAVVYMSVLCRPDSSAYGAGLVRFRNLDTGEEFYDEGETVSTRTTYQQGEHRIFQAVNVGDVEGDTIEVEFYDADEADYRFSFGGFVMSDHTHSVDTTQTTETTAGASPEVVTEFDGNEYYPSDVSIEVNGSQVATIAGDDTTDWTETINLEDELTPGENTISATPSTRGELNLSLASELFRRGRSED